ncbi:MAG TPA: BtpA/SgcQ family protein [Phycisphaerae bacterium]|nr:BtpA/SgcQ family protein [Phycisphaerae bacterium]
MPLHKGRRAADIAGKNVVKLRLIGMVHLPALPGSARAAMPMAQIIRRAVSEARQLADAGFDAVIVENFGDAPFHADCVPAETIAGMSVVVDHVVQAAQISVGANVLRNDGAAGVAIAAATGAAFIRVNVLSGVYATDQGFITGRAAELLARRAAAAPTLAIAADVHVKHAQPISQPDIALAAEETAYRGGADVLIVSGVATGSPADLDQVRRVAKAVPDRPIWIGSGVTAESVKDYLRIADGVIVGTALKKGGKTTADLDSRRVREFVKAAR